MVDRRWERERGKKKKEKEGSQCVYPLRKKRKKEDERAEREAGSNPSVCSSRRRGEKE